MPQQERMPGTAREKRNCWSRGNGPYSFRGELRRGISLNKKHLVRKVRRGTDVEFAPKGNGYRRIKVWILLLGETAEQDMAAGRALEIGGMAWMRKASVRTGNWQGRQ